MHDLGTARMLAVRRDHQAQIVGTHEQVRRTRTVDGVFDDIELLNLCPAPGELGDVLRFIEHHERNPETPDELEYGSTLGSGRALRGTGVPSAQPLGLHVRAPVVSRKGVVDRRGQRLPVRHVEPVPARTHAHAGDARYRAVAVGGSGGAGRGQPPAPPTHERLRKRRLPHPGRPDEEDDLRRNACGNARLDLIERSAQVRMIEDHIGEPAQGDGDDVAAW